MGCIACTCVRNNCMVRDRAIKSISIQFTRHTRTILQEQLSGCKTEKPNLFGLCQKPPWKSANGSRDVAIWTANPIITRQGTRPSEIPSDSCRINTQLLRACIPAGKRNKNINLLNKSDRIYIQWGSCELLLPIIAFSVITKPCYTSFYSVVRTVCYILMTFQTPPPITQVPAYIFLAS
jgi:hypothetical protein